MMQIVKRNKITGLHSRLKEPVVLLLLTVLTPLTQAAETAQVSGSSVTDQAALKAEALSLVKAFAGELKPTLKAAMQSGGPVHAIDVCAQQAPAIARRLSESSGWQIKRVSLKARNTSTAVPDAFERQVLEDFDARQQQGVAVSDLVHAARVDDRFRFMKAQGVEPLCLNCHGQSLSSSVQSALNTHYPNDRATGYKLGEVRGAFSLSRPLP